MADTAPHAPVSNSMPPCENKVGDEKQLVSSTNAVEGFSQPISSEYAEYLEMSQSFQGPRFKNLVRKLDVRVLPQLVFLYLMAYIDRSNVGNAKLFGALADLHMDGLQWNTALSVFFVSYSVSAAPANLALKRFGPRRWLSCLLTSVSVIQICASLQSSYGGWISFRFLLGIVEAGIFPGCSFVLSSWYAPKEVHTRMAFFYSGASLAGAFSGLLAYAIGQLDHTWGYRGWRFIYCIEGLFTLLCGIAAWWIILDMPAKSGGWLDKEEKQFLVLRQKFIHGGENGIAEDDNLTWKHVRTSLLSPHVWAISFIQFTLVTAVYGLSYSLPTIIANLGYTAANAQALSAPPYVFACLVTILSGILADRYNQRMLAIFLPSIMSLAGFIIIIVTIRYTSLTGVTLFGIFLAAGGLYPVSPACTAWISQNQAGTTQRTVGIAITFMAGSLGGIVGSNIYLANESPTYPTGFGITIGFIVVGGLIWPLCYWAWLKRINAKRAAIPEEEIAKYTPQQLSDMGDNSPLFRYQT